MRAHPRRRGRTGGNNRPATIGASDGARSDQTAGGNGAADWCMHLQRSLRRGIRQEVGRAATHSWRYASNRPHGVLGAAEHRVRPDGRPVDRSRPIHAARPGHGALGRHFHQLPRLGLAVLPLARVDLHRQLSPRHPHLRQLRGRVPGLPSTQRRAAHLRGRPATGRLPHRDDGQVPERLRADRRARRGRRHHGRSRHLRTRRCAPPHSSTSSIRTESASSTTSGLTRSNCTTSPAACRHNGWRVCIPSSEPSRAATGVRRAGEPCMCRRSPATRVHQCRMLNRAG